MNVVPVKTHAITEKDTDILKILDQYLPKLEENSVVAVTSKIVAICEGRIAPLTSDKDALVEQEAQYYLPRHSSKYNFSTTITQGLLVATAGIDESNANGYYVLWPNNPQYSVNTIREHLAAKFGLHNIGVIITDSRTTPLRWGVTGTAIAHSGFAAYNDYIGKNDLFGREFQFERLNVADCFASAGVAVMGEGAEQTPLAVITDIPFVEFQDRNPTQEELDVLHIDIADDLYAPLLTAVKWEKGKASK